MASVFTEGGQPKEVNIIKILQTKMNNDYLSIYLSIFSTYPIIHICLVGRISTVPTGNSCTVVFVVDLLLLQTFMTYFSFSFNTLMKNCTMSLILYMSRLPLSSFHLSHSITCSWVSYSALQKSQPRFPLYIFL